MRRLTHPSPNFGSRKGIGIDMLVIHYTGMETGRAALDRLCDPKAEVSAHYMIDEDGTLYALVEEDQRAWHAGVSFWRGETDINSRSIGIELVNPGHEFGLHPFAQPQMAVLTDLTLGLVARHAIAPRHVVGHSDIAPARKQDPGELFDWQGLAKAGVGLWPDAMPQAGGASPAALAEYGYDVLDMAAAIAAFQRHFRPEKIDAVWDADCAARLKSLLTQCG